MSNESEQDGGCTRSGMSSQSEDNISHSVPTRPVRRPLSHRDRVEAERAARFHESQSHDHVAQSQEEESAEEEKSDIFKGCRFNANDIREAERLMKEEVDEGWLRRHVVSVDRWFSKMGLTNWPTFETWSQQDLDDFPVHKAITKFLLVTHTEARKAASATSSLSPASSVSSTSRSLSSPVVDKPATPREPTSYSKLRDKRNTLRPSPVSTRKSTKRAAEPSVQPVDDGPLDDTPDAPSDDERGGPPSTGGINGPTEHPRRRDVFMDAIYESLKTAVMPNEAVAQLIKLRTIAGCTQYTQDIVERATLRFALDKREQRVSIVVIAELDRRSVVEEILVDHDEHKSYESPTTFSMAVERIKRTFDRVTKVAAAVVATGTVAYCAYKRPKQVVGACFPRIQLLLWACKEVVREKGFLALLRGLKVGIMNSLWMTLRGWAAWFGPAVASMGLKGLIMLVIAWVVNKMRPGNAPRATPAPKQMTDGPHTLVKVGAFVLSGVVSFYLCSKLFGTGTGVSVGAMPKPKKFVATAILGVSALVTLRYHYLRVASWIEPRGASRQSSPPTPVAGNVVVLPAAAPTTLDRCDLQRNISALTFHRTVEVKGPNLYTWWYNVPCDITQDVNGVATQGWLTQTSTMVALPATYVHEMSSHCASIDKLTRTSLDLTTVRCMGYQVPLAAPSHVKANIIRYGALICWYEALPIVYDKVPKVESKFGSFSLLDKVFGLALGAVVLGAMTLSVGTVMTSKRSIVGRDVLSSSWRWLVPSSRVYAILWAPVVEEAVRMLAPASFTAWIVMYEGFRVSMLGQPLACVGSTTMHVTNCTTMLTRGRSVRTYCECVLTHILFNAYAYWSSPDLNDAIMSRDVIDSLYGDVRGMTVGATLFQPKTVTTLWKGLLAHNLETVPPMKQKPRGGHALSHVFPFCPYDVPILPVALQVQYGLSSSNYRPVAYANSKTNVKEALYQRVLYDRPGTDAPAVFATRGVFVNYWTGNRCARLKELFQPTPVYSVSIHEYLSRSNAKPGVKKKIQRAYDCQKIDGTRRSNALPKTVVKKWSRLACFVKVENLNYRTKYGVKIKAPRMIMGCKPDFTCLVGPWLMSLSDHLKQHLNGSKGFLFTSGVSAKQASDFLGMENGYVDEETDVAQWDRSVHSELRMMMLTLYSLFSPPIAVRQLLTSVCKQTRGITSNGVKFEMFDALGLLATQVNSGLQDTSFGNSTLNALIRIWGFASRWGVTVTEVCKLVKVLVQGDDGASRAPAHLPRVDWPRVFAECGFELEYKMVDSPSELSFCSMWNYPVEGGTCFGPKIGRIFAKTCFLLDPHPKLDPKAVARGVALGFANAAAFIRPLEMWCNRLLELCGEGKVVESRREEWQMTFTRCTPNTHTAAFLYGKYGWCEWMEKALADELSKMTWGGGEGGQVYDHIIECDTDGPVY